MTKKQIRLTESQLHNIIKETVNKVLKEGLEDNNQQKIKLQYQYKNIPKQKYEVRELIHVCDPNKSDRENLNDAFDKACDLGADPNKNVRWKWIE